MTDFEPGIDAAAPVEPVAGEAPAAKKSFLSTGAGKLVIVVVALGVLAIIAGVVIALVLFVFGKSVVDDMDITITPAESTSTVETTETAEAAAPAEAVENSEVFTFRDIFEPLLVPLVEPSTDSTTSSTPDTDTANTTTSGTLYLTNIIVEGTEYQAVLSLDGVTYTLSDGERVGSTPWQVVTVNGTSVVMLYGDTQVTLTIGQGITK